MYRPRNTEDLCSKCTESSRTCGQPRDTVQRVSISRVFAMLRADDIAHGVGTGRTRQNRMSTIVVTQEQLRGARVAAQTRARLRVPSSLGHVWMSNSLRGGPRPRVGRRYGFLMPRTVNGTGHTGPSEFCATSIQAVLRRSSQRCSSPLALFRPRKKVSLSLPAFR